MTNLSIEDILKSNMADQSSVLSKKENWMEIDFLDKKMLNFTRPHSDGFYNPLGLDTFLFHFKKEEWLNFFPVLLIKDGLLSILHFFYKNPEPRNIKTILLLPKQVSHLIPPQWQDQCYLYEISRHKLNHPKASKLFLTTLVTPELYSTDSLKRSLELVNKEAISLKGLFFRHQPLGEEAIDTNNDADYNLFNILKEELNSEIEFCDWRSVKGSDLSNSSFLELNSNNFWYNDSTVAHTFLSQGSYPIDERYQESEFDDSSCLRISRYHFYKFTMISKEDKKTGEQAWQEIRSLPKHILEGESKLDRKVQDYKKIFLCTEEFKSLAMDIVRKYSADASL